MDAEQTAKNTAFLKGAVRAQIAFIEYKIDKKGQPVFYEGSRIEGFTTLFHMAPHNVLVSGCCVGAQDLRRAISAIATSLVENYEIPRHVMALTLIQLAKDIVEEGVEDAE